MEAIIPAPYRPNYFHRVGGWLPDDSEVLTDWVRKFVADVDERYPTPRIPGAPEWPEPIQELDHLIRSTAELRMLASAMFDEVPNKFPYKRNPVGYKQVRSYEHMLHLFAIIMTRFAPIWSKTGYGVGLIGFPFNAILDWPMATPSGYAFFLKPEVNKKLRVILDTWRDDVLMTDKSQHVITTGKHGWLSDEARITVESDTNSWDQFFVREFRDIDMLRPVAFESDLKWVVNSCESKPFALQTNVNEHDTFWLKGQPYSVAEMLNHLDEADNFIGGTVYQAFLSATSYHRWNSPVKGDIVYADVVEGTYFSEPTITGFTSPQGPDPAAPDQAQGYITHVATRAIFLIQTGEPIGLVGAIYIGMADVSSCEISSKFQLDLPKPVDKGEEIGMFHHGGSTHCLLFQKGLKLAWVTAASPSTAKKNVPIRSELAYAYS
ncbi:Phophatidylserine decarboxylase-domain-containing protein [Xylariaceae sp. FL0662B]|nr:Phophatidylserine decarboxylase-domain-containing protein [Xylariaceae sp. FL0662B]